MSAVGVVVLRGVVPDVTFGDRYGYGFGDGYSDGYGFGYGYGDGRGDGCGYSAPSLIEGTK